MGDWVQPLNLRSAEHLFQQGDSRRTIKGGFKGSDGKQFYGTWDALVERVNKSPDFISGVYDEQELLAAWRRGSLGEVATLREQRSRSASPRMPREKSEFQPTPAPAVISANLPPNFLDGTRGLSVSTKDKQGRSVSTSITSQDLFRRLQTVDENTISAGYPAAAGSSADLAPLPRFGKAGVERREDLFCPTQRVRYRDEVGEPWELGSVASVDPLLVLPRKQPAAAIYCNLVEAIAFDLEDRDISEKNDADLREEREAIQAREGDFNNNDSYGRPAEEAQLSDGSRRTIGWTFSDIALSDTQEPQLSEREKEIHQLNILIDRRIEFISTLTGSDPEAERRETAELELQLNRIARLREEPNHPAAEPTVPPPPPRRTPQEEGADMQASQPAPPPAPSTAAESVMEDAADVDISPPSMAEARFA